jgi:iron-sulfur cluster assembly protein
MALKVSNAAVKQVKELKQAQSLGDDVFLRMGVKGGGCSGMSYALEFDTELGPEDRGFQIDGVRVVCDKKSYLYLNETTLDYVQQGSRAGSRSSTPTPSRAAVVVRRSPPRAERAATTRERERS